MSFDHVSLRAIYTVLITEPEKEAYPGNGKTIQQRQLDINSKVNSYIGRVDDIRGENNAGN